MKIPNNWQGAKKQESFNKIVPGGYIARIMNVDESEDGNRIKVSYDIAQGEFKDYYAQQYERWGGTWRGNSNIFVTTQDGDVTNAFSNFIYCVEESNRNFAWDWDERKLKGKMVGIVLREREWKAPDGEVKILMDVDKWLTVADIANGNFKVRDIRKLTNTDTKKTSNNNNRRKSDPFKDTKFDINDNDLQF